jgi:hypothetical protein
MATKVWLGGAVDIAQVDTVTIGGTWATDETITLSIGGNDLVVTVGGPTATASVAASVSAAVNASGKTDNLASNESRNVGGQEIAEFTEISASASGNVVTLEANTNGIPFTLSASETASAGTVTATTTVAATGANFYDNVQNWSGATVPVSGDKLVFQQNEIDCLYGLSQAATTNVTLQSDASYTGKIGLPAYNGNGYDEYRNRHLTLNFSNAERSIVIGEGPGSGSNRINLNFDSSDPKMVIALTNTAESGAKAAIDVIGGNTATDISIRRGSLSIGADSSNTATIRELEISYFNQRATDAEVTIGDNVTISEITKDGGSLTLINTPTGLTVSTVTNRAGLVTFNGQAQVTNMFIEGGEMRWHSTGTCATLTLSGSAIFDVSRDLRPKIIVNPIERHSDNSRIIDPNKSISSLVIDNNRVSNLSNLQLGSDIRITRGATA